MGHAGAFPAAPAATPLEVQDAVISDVENGRNVDASYGFSPGQRVYLDFKIAGFQVSEGGKQVYLETDIRAVDDLGRLLAPPQTEVTTVEIAPEDKNWRPIVRYQIEIPPTPRAATHRFLISVKDKLASTETHREISFQVRSPFPAPPDKLEIYGWKWITNDEPRKILGPEPSFRPPDQIHGRFYLTGFRFTGNNAYRLEYGISVRNSAGKILLSIPKAAEMSKESFYPEAYVPCEFSINLEKSTAAGDYVLVIAAKDITGAQQAEAERRFRVE